MKSYLIEGKHSAKDIGNIASELQTNSGFRRCERVRIFYGALQDTNSIVPSQIEAHKDVLNLLVTDVTSENILIQCVVKHYGVDDTTNAKVVPLVLKAFYDVDALQEETIKKWHGSDSVENSFGGVDEEALKLVKEKATPFVAWLQQDDGDSSDSEDSSDSSDSA